MYTRLSVSVVISLLLHAAVIFALVMMYGRSPVRDQHRPASGPMVVQFAPANSPVSSGTGSKHEKSAKPGVPRETPPQAAAAQQLSTPFSGRSGYTPQPYRQMQVEIQRMNAVQARMFAAQQQQMAIISLQDRIAGALRGTGAPHTGECHWDVGQNDATMKCEPEALAQALSGEAATLTSLRQSMRAQGMVLDGFTVTAKDNAPLIEYHTRRP